MAEKTLGNVALKAYLDGIGTDSYNDWQAVADAVIAAHEARRWKAIESAPKGIVLVGKWHRGVWTWKQTEFVHVAIEDGYTHWTLIPAPPKEASDAE